MENVLAISLFVLLILALVHLLYESVILPNVRMTIKFKLFRLRDRLRRIKIEKSDELDSQTFRVIEGSINTTISFLHRATVSTIFDSQRIINSDDKLKKRIEKRVRFVSEIQSQELKEIINDVTKCFLHALVINSMMLLIYVIPIILFFAFYNVIKGAITYLAFSVDLKPKEDFSNIAVA